MICVLNLVISKEYFLFELISFFLMEENNEERKSESQCFISRR